MRPADDETLAEDAARLPASDELTVVDPNHYQLGEELSRRSFGRLIRAHDRRLDRDVAIKQLRAMNAQVEARFGSKRASRLGCLIQRSYRSTRSDAGPVASRSTR